MKNLTKITSLAVGIFLFTGSSQLFAQATSLGNLLDLVEQDRVAESEEYSQRVQEFEQNANRQQEILDITNDRIIEQEDLQDQLSDQFEANEIIIADKREILRAVSYTHLRAHET